MICHDAAFDNYRYFKWGVVYLLDMKNLSSTHSDLYEMFLCGYHTISRKKTKSSFNCVSAAMALEQSLNKDTKTKGKKYLCYSLEKNARLEMPCTHISVSTHSIINIVYGCYMIYCNTKWIYQLNIRL